MNGLDPLLVFKLEGQRYALPLLVVDRVVRAAEITPLPRAPPPILGVIDMAGRILPVLEVRQRFGLRSRALHPSDQFLLARLGLRIVVLVIDEARGVIDCPPGKAIEPRDVAPGLEHVNGIVPLDDGLILIQDLEKFLSLDESVALDKALAQVALNKPPRLRELREALARCARGRELQQG